MIGNDIIIINIPCFKNIQKLYDYWDQVYLFCCLTKILKSLNEDWNISSKYIWILMLRYAFTLKKKKTRIKGYRKKSRYTNYW